MADTVELENFDRRPQKTTVSAQHGHGAVSNLRPLCDQKRTSTEARLRQNTGGKRDHESWPVQHAWLAKRLNDMHRVFVNRVSEIDADT
jgi:hypothetical protein